MQLTLDGVALTQGVEISSRNPYQISETYPCLGGHSLATNYCNGAVVALRHNASGSPYALELRAYEDAVAFRFIIPGGTSPRVPDEATTFLLPEASTIWYHDLSGHYEGVNVKKDIGAIYEGEWAAPPVTFKLPGAAGYGSITEAALIDYAGMALQADGHCGLTIRLGHSHPPSHPYLLRYGTSEAVRLSQPASLVGTITTPWRVVLVGPDLNTLVNSDVVTSLCPPPDPKLFPKGIRTDWIRPGRAVWKYLDGSGSNSLATMKDFTRWAGELGFEHHVVEGFWSRWTDADIKELVAYGRERHVGIWLWKHSKSLQDPRARSEFIRHCRNLGVTGP
jgi:alpha-glucosidase